MISQVHPLERFLWELTFHRPLDEEDREALLGLPMRMRHWTPAPISCAKAIYRPIARS